MRALVNCEIAGQQFFIGDVVDINAADGHFWASLGILGYSAEENDGALVVYLGENLSTFQSGMSGVHFERGIPRKAERKNADAFRELFPEYQVINEKSNYVGGSVTLESFDELAGQLPENPRILAMRDCGLGDVLLLMPTLREIKRRIPGARVELATMPAYHSIIETNDALALDAVHSIHEVDLQNQSYDLIINFMRSVELYSLPRNRGPRVDSFAAQIGMKLTERVFVPDISTGDMADAAALLGSGPFIGYVQQAASWMRTYPLWRAREVFAEIHARFPGHKIAVFDTQAWGLYDDLDYVLDMSGRTANVSALAACMKLCDAVISPDTGAAHLAASLDIPTLVLLASQPFEWRYSHYGAHVKSIHKVGAAPCVPCWDFQRERATVKYCSISKKNICMESINPHEIAASVDKMLNGRAARETISAVILCHNNCDMTRECIMRLLAGTETPDEIILVDNASDDETQAHFSTYSGMNYIRREVNDGSIIGRNIGIKAATCDRVLVLDNDQMVGIQTIEKYLDQQDDIVGAVLCETNQIGVGHTVSEFIDTGLVYLGIGGLCVRRKVLETIGYLDEAFSPAYCDDPDFFWRARAAGFSWSWLADNGIEHRAHATLGVDKTLKNDANYRRSHDRLIAKWPNKFPLAYPISGFPLVSYVIPAFNRAAFLPECIDSVLAQTYSNIEIIVVDDGSTDGTEKLIKEKYPMVKYIKNETNKRIPYTLNRGFRAARGEFICWLSSDDGIFPEKTETQLKYMTNRKDIDLSWTEYEIRWRGDAAYTGQAGRVQHWKPKPFPNNQDEFMYCLSQKICNANGSTSMFRRSALRTMGYFIESLYFMNDWEMWLRYLRARRAGLVTENLGWRNEHSGVSQGFCQREPEAVARFYAEQDFVADYYRLFTDAARPRICAMLVVKNEEFEIERCLDDLILWVDKIVVVDDGSSDRTLQILKQYPKVVAIHEKPDLGNIRNEGRDREILFQMAQNTGCEWILFIDADEVFEDRMKRHVYDLITNENVNLWHFKEINFWRSKTHFRVDELYDKGWFGRLFRNFDFLRMRSGEEHSGGVPCNIPGASMFWSDDNGTGRKAIPGVLHYGFSDYTRNVEKAYRRNKRDPYSIDNNGCKRGGWYYYERMINETGLEVREYRSELI